MSSEYRTLNHSKFLIMYHVLRKLKQETTIRIWNPYPELKKQFWKEKTFWSDGHFCCSIGNASIETVRKYIEEQG